MPSLSSNSYAIGTRTGWQVQARCLMLNHFHLVVETPPLNVVVGMKWFRVLGPREIDLLRRSRLPGRDFILQWFPDHAGRQAS